MDEEAQAVRQEQAIQDQIAHYNELINLGNEEAVQKILDINLRVATDKLVLAFTSDTIKDWKDFCTLRGEVFSCLYPVQEIRGAKAIAEHLRSQLDNLYPKQQ